MNQSEGLGGICQKFTRGDFAMQLPTGTSFYGTGEVSGGVERTGKRVSIKIHQSLVASFSQ